MPIYEYVCTSCGNEFEAMRKFSDSPLTECACGKSGTVQRKLSLAAFQLKGNGWYKDKYSAGQGAKASSEAGVASDSKSGSAESAKPAAHACGGACSCG
jgi:putative FmdB family regulatory protein